MNKLLILGVSMGGVAGLSGCQLQEIRSKSKFGPEFRHDASSDSNVIRWTAQQGFALKWEDGWETGITYRRRDIDNGDADRDDGIWIDFSFPLWRAKKKNETAKRIRRLEERMARLEQLGNSSNGRSPTSDRGKPSPSGGENTDDTSGQLIVLEGV